MTDILRFLKNFTPLITFSILLLTGCGLYNSQCSDFPVEYSYPPTGIFDLSDEPDHLTEEFLNRINICYNANPVDDIRGELSLEYVKRYNDELFAVFEIYGVSDVRIIYRIGHNGKIIDGYIVSLA